MIGRLKILFAAGSACAVLAGSSVALARDDQCMANDRKVPERTQTCRYGKVWICEKGEWKELGLSCSS
jgi:hypothetical protein